LELLLENVKCECKVKVAGAKERSLEEEMMIFGGNVEESYTGRLLSSATTQAG
jgi:hypothetical protein